MNALHPLGRLFQSVEDSRGWTLREIARRIERSGRTISHAYVGRLKREPIQSVSYETIRALAIGLDVPERVVGLAALDTMGVHDLEPDEVGIPATIARDPDLTDRDRRILLAVVREMQRGQDDHDQGVDTARGMPVARDAGPDGVTTEHRDDAGDDEHEVYPWEKGDFDLAAKRGRNRGREMRERQDRDAEDGGA